jgi:N-acetylglucosaminyl-diphospho-decaprenol L-rhamnosyltransferase
MKKNTSIPKLVQDISFSLNYFNGKLPSLSIIIVNWNADKYLIDCLNAIKKSLVTNFIQSEIIVVDNASTDGSTNAIKSTYKDVKIINNSNNSGFGVACNQGARMATGDYLLFLNPDTILKKDTLSNVFDFLMDYKNSSLGLLSIKQVDQQGQTIKTCNRLPSFSLLFKEVIGLAKICPRYFKGLLMQEWDHEDNREVEHPMGAFILIKASLFANLQGFDEDFFVYSEDTDLCFRLKKAGYTSFYLAQAEMLHYVSATTEDYKSHRFAFALEGRMIYVNKHFKMIEKLILTALLLVVFPLSRIMLQFLKGSIRGCSEIIKGYYMFIQRYYFHE